MKLPQGYQYSSLYAGIRKAPKDDLALILSETPAAAAAMFTTNRVQAAPVVLARRNLADSGGRVKAVLVNAGNANCATRTGARVARSCCRELGRLLGAPAECVFPASTGVIGVELDASLITSKLPALVEGLSPRRFTDVASAIMTTDTAVKTASAAVEARGGPVTVAGMAKGSGMIHPNMATTLAFVMTDAACGPLELFELLAPAVEASFHRVSVDGDTSTNDLVLLLANGSSGERLAAGGRRAFRDALAAVLTDLARKIARDGEGARKLVTIEVEGAETNGDAVQIARTIANSPLVKTAIAGGDPNWGRILGAAGYAGVAFDPAKVDIWLQGVPVCRAGLAAPFSEQAMEKKLGRKECLIRFVIRGRSRGTARFWTCDLTEGYIRINADYRT